MTSEAPPAGSPRTLLAVFAHPDDESFGPGGALARYAAEGVDVWLVCGTDGEAGTVDAEMLADYTSTAQLRAAELCCAAQTLGLKGVDWLGYRDSGMAGSPDNNHPDSLHQAPLEEVTGHIVAAIRRHRPQVVLCDNPFGGYGHPDHLKLHAATVAAFQAAADPARFADQGAPYRPQQLFYTAFSTRALKIMVRLLPLLGRDPRRFGRNRDVDLLQIVSWETPIHARLDVRRYLAVKQAASACHKSQGGGDGGPYRLIPGPLRRRLVGYENFMQGFPEPRPGAAMVTDLFAGVSYSPIDGQQKAPNTRSAQ